MQPRRSRHNRWSNEILEQYEESYAPQGEKQPRPQVKPENKILQEKYDSEHKQAEYERSYENAGSHRKLQFRQPSHTRRAPANSHDVTAELSLSQNLNSLETKKQKSDEVLDG